MSCSCCVPAYCCLLCERGLLAAFSPKAACQLDVFRHDRDAFGVDGAEIGVLKEAHQIRLRSLLQRQNRRALESQIIL